MFGLIWHFSEESTEAADPILHAGPDFMSKDR